MDIHIFTLKKVLKSLLITLAPTHVRLKLCAKISYQVIIRTWQTADKMKSQRGSIEPSGSNNDNLRIKRYIAKYTINPAIANGFSQYVGSVQVCYFKQ